MGSLGLTEDLRDLVAARRSRERAKEILDEARRGLERVHALPGTGLAWPKTGFRLRERESAWPERGSTRPESGLERPGAGLGRGVSGSPGIKYRPVNSAS